MSNLPARFAENAFWMARYMERAENLARIVDVNQTLARDDRDGQQWLPIVQLNADDGRFYEKHEEATQAAVLHFYILDDANPTSIRSTVRMARENARTLRHLISTEMWMQLNVFYEFLKGLRARDIARTNVNRLCQAIKESCQTHTGITEGTFFRDETWHFYNIGKHLERADQASRLLDIKYRFLLPADGELPRPLDVSQWNTLLRSVAGYHAFRRIHPRGIRSGDVVEFLVSDRNFPRSIGSCIEQVVFLTRDLDKRFRIPIDGAMLAALDDLQAAVQEQTVESTAQRDVDALVDRLQLRLAALSNEMNRAFFGGAQAFGGAPERVP